MSLSDDRLVTEAIHDLVEGRRSSEAIEQLCDHVIVRLARWARMMLGRIPRGAADEDDVAQSALETFCARASAGRFPTVERLDQVWSILYSYTLHESFSLRHSNSQT
jgi:hypothetical protein